MNERAEKINRLGMSIATWLNGQDIDNGDVPDVLAVLYVNYLFRVFRDAGPEAVAEIDARFRTICGNGLKAALEGRLPVEPLPKPGKGS